jgi:cysteine-rich repeat protein
LIRNSTISGNLAEGGIGGALLTGLGDHVISDSTITQNESLASDGDFTGGIRGDNLILKNSIIAGNVSSSTPENIVDCDEAVTSQDYNVFGIGCPGLVPGPNDQIGTVNDPLDPLLGELQNNGGPTDTHALLESSPAIDKGDPNCAGTDQRGVARPQGNACDIGAYEANCGDAIAQGAEECDDGNTDPDDDCDNTCKLTSTGGGIDNGSNGGCALIDKSSYNAIGMLGAALGMMLMGLIRWRKQQ